MLGLLRRVLHILPTFIFAFILSVAVWIISTSQADPTSQQNLARPVAVGVVGQDPGTVLTGLEPKAVTVTINAPLSVWNRLNSEDNLVTASIDLAGLGPGKHSVKVQPNILVHPSDLIQVIPQYVTVTLEKLTTRNFAVHLVETGEPAIGFQAGSPTMTPTSVSVSGPDSAVSVVQEVRATVDENQIHDSIDRTILLQPLDPEGTVVSGVTLTPDRVSVQIPITQRYGFRTVSVKAIITGQVASGYRLTNISVFPLAVTVSSTNPQLVNDLPGFVETAPVNVDGIKNAIDVQVPLNLPQGVKVEGAQTVLVQVGIAVIESNLTLRNMAVTPANLAPGLSAQFSPDSVDIIVSGPLPSLDLLNPNDISITVDLTGKDKGIFQATPTVQIKESDIQVVSIQPGTVEVTIGPAPTATPTHLP